MSVPTSTTGFRAAINLTRIAAPFIAISFSRMLMSFIDFIMVGGISTAAQAAISPATIFVFAIS